MPKLNLEINNQYSSLATPEAATIRLFETLHQSGRFPTINGELSIVFVSDIEISRIHNEFSDDPTPTDVITFPADDTMESAGEIIVSVDQALGRTDGLEYEFSRELCLYLIHGWLHLANYNDGNEAECAQMRKAEYEALALLDKSEEPIEFILIRDSN